MAKNFLSSKNRLLCLVKNIQKNKVFLLFLTVYCWFKNSDLCTKTCIKRVFCAYFLLYMHKIAQNLNFSKNHFTTKCQSVILLVIEKPLNALTKDKGCLTNGVRELSVGARQSSPKQLIPFEAERLKIAVSFSG